MNIGIFLEIENNKILPVGLELIGKAIDMMGTRSYKIQGIAVVSSYGRQHTDFNRIKKYLDELFIYEYEDKWLTTEHYRDTLCEYVENNNPNILLIGATPLGRSFAPRVATYFKTGITADCTELKYDDKYGLIQIRPAFGEEVMAEIVTPETFPQMATVRPGAMEPPVEEGKKNPKVTIEKRKLSRKNLTIINRYKIKEEIKLDRAEIVVVAGNAIKEEEELLLAEKVAKYLRGELGVTRPLVEGGLAPHYMQVGVSGNILSASVVLLLGVSGSNQTMAGIRKAKKIAAVNNDPKANIFNKVDIGIVDDWKRIAVEILGKKGGV